MLKGMLSRKGAVGSKGGSLWKIDVLKDFLGKKEVSGLKMGLSSIGHGGTSTFFYMMEQFDSMGVPAQFSI